VKIIFNLMTESKSVQLVACLRKMGDHMHLNREKAWNQYKELMKDAKQEEEFISIDIVKLLANSSRWEDRFGSLAASQTLIERESSSHLVEF
jgi:hypothetical protein